MRFELGNNSRVLHGKLSFIGNVINGSFIALTYDGLDFIKELQEGNEIPAENLSADNKQILETALHLGIITKKGAQCDDKDDITFSTAYFHITNYCNYQCIGICSYEGHRNKSEDLSTEEVEIILRFLRSLGVKVLVISGGEPFIREDLVILLKIAKHDLNFEKIILGSNGSLITENLMRSLMGNIDSLVIAVDGYNGEKASFIRDDGSFEKSILAIQLAKANKIPVSILPTIHKKIIVICLNISNLAKSYKFQSRSAF